MFLTTMPLITSGTFSQTGTGLPGSGAARLRSDPVAAGAERIGDLQRELRDALSRVDVATGRAEGAAQSSGPLAAAAVNARSSAELAAGRIGETAETLRGKTVSVDMGRALAPLRTLKAKQGAELDRLRQMAEKARTDADMSALWKQAVARYSAEARPGVEKSITAEAPPGYERETDHALGSPSQRGMALDESFADFIRASGSDRATLNNPDAKNVWKALETINRLSRAGIVILPFRHAIPNLGMAYLAGDATSAVRGDPETMLRILLGRYRADPDVYRRAVEAGATSPFSVGAFAGT